MTSLYIALGCVAGGVLTGAFLAFLDAGLGKTLRDLWHRAFCSDEYETDISVLCRYCGRFAR